MAKNTLAKELMAARNELAQVAASAEEQRRLISRELIDTRNKLAEYVVASDRQTQMITELQAINQDLGMRLSKYEEVENISRIKPAEAEQEEEGAKS